MVNTGKKPKPIETYAWLCGDQQCDTIDCYKSEHNSQTVCKLWEVTALSDFHDSRLAAATKRINAILGRLEKSNRNKKRKLSFVKHQNQLMVVWAGYGVVGPDDDFKTIKKALKLGK